MEYYEKTWPTPDKPQTISFPVIGENLITTGITHQCANLDYVNNICCDRKYEEKRKEEENMGEQFLKIKREQELGKLEKDKYDKIKEIKETDPIVKIMKEAQKSIMAIEEDRIGSSFPVYNYYTKETSKKIDEIYKKHSEKEDKIICKYQEIEALCDGASWEERMKIYKIYGIVED